MRIVGEGIGDPDVGALSTYTGADAKEGERLPMIAFLFDISL